MILQLDEDESGSISKPEFSSALDSLGFHFSEFELRELFRQLDPDESGEIDFRELHRAMQVPPPCSSPPSPLSPYRAHPCLFPTLASLFAPRPLSHSRFLYATLTGCFLWFITGRTSCEPRV